MTVKMAKTAAYSITAEISGGMMPDSYEMDVLCLMDMGNTAALMRAKPLLPPRQESALKSGIVYKWSKAVFEKYFLWKIKHGLSNLP